MSDLRFDKLYRYDELTAILQGFAESYPSLMRLESIGKSYEGRAYTPSAATRYARDITNHRCKVDWVVHAPAGGTVTLIARHERAGTVRAEVTL